MITMVRNAGWAWRAVALIYLSQLSPSLMPAQDERAKDITFDDVKLDIEAGDEFYPELITDEIKKLEEVRVKLRGFIFPTPKQNGLKAFILVRDNQECCYGPNAAIHDCVLVRLKKGDEIAYTTRAVTVEGIFRIKEFRPRKSSRPLAVYRMMDCEVTQ